MSNTEQPPSGATIRQPSKAEAFVMANPWIPLAAVFSVLENYDQHSHFYESGEFAERCKEQADSYTLEKKHEFNAALSRFPLATMNFGQALEALKAGNKVQREGWNGKGMFLALMPGFVIPAAMINERTRKFVQAPDQDLNCGGYIVMWTAQQVWQPGWLASQADMLAEDWSVMQ